jgi:hypothetical protein
MVFCFSGSSFLGIIIPPLQELYRETPDFARPEPGGRLPPSCFSGGKMKNGAFIYY